MMRAVVPLLCLCVVASADHSRPTPKDLIDKFREALPGAFPNGLKDNIESVTKVANDVTNDLTLGNTQVTKDELEEAKRILKLTAVASIAQKKHAADDLLDEEEFMKSSEGEMKAAEANVDSMIDNLLKTGVIQIVERDPAKMGFLYNKAKEQLDKKAEDQKTSGLVSNAHKNTQVADVPGWSNMWSASGKAAEKIEANLDVVEYYGLENLHKLVQLPQRPDLLPGGEGYAFNQKRAKQTRELKAMARRWRQDPRPVGRLTGGDVLDNKEGIVREIFQSYDHNNDNSLELAEFNELQADTDGPDSVNTKEEFGELLEQVEDKDQNKLHFTTFRKLYLDPWMSEKFETILPVDYHALLEAGKVKGEAMAETWADEDEYMEGAKMMEPLWKQDDEEEEKKAEAIAAEIEKQEKAGNPVSSL